MPCPNLFMILWYDLIQFYKHVQTCPWWYVLIRFLSMSRLVWKWIHDEIAKNGSNLSEWQTIIPWWKSYSLDRFDKRAVKNRLFTAKWIRDRSIFSSFLPKYIIQQFVWLFMCFVRVANLIANLKLFKKSKQ